MKKQPTRKQPPRPLLQTEEEGPFYEAPFRDPAEETLASIAAQHGPDVSYKVYKIENGQRVYVATLNGLPSEITEENVKALNYGPGRYAVLVLVSGEYRTAIQMALAAPPSSAVHEAHESPVLKALADQMRMLQEFMMRQSSVEREPMSQLITALVQAKGLLGSSEPKELPVDTIMKCIELGKALQSGEADDSLMGVVKEIAKEAGPAIGQFLTARAGMSAPPAPRQIQQENPPVQVVSDETQLKGAIAILKRKCASGSDPGLYIELVLDSYYDSPVYQKLVYRCGTEDFSEFAKLDGEISAEPFNKFFRTIYDGLRSAYLQANSLGADTGGKNGNAANTPENGGPGKNGSKRS